MAKETVRELAGCAWMVLLFVLALVGCATVFVWLMWLLMQLVI